MNQQQQRDLMTAPQREAYRKACDILGEHFSNVVCTVLFEPNAPELNGQASESWVHGGAVTAVGMLQLQMNRMMPPPPINLVVPARPPAGGGL